MSSQLNKQKIIDRQMLCEQRWFLVSEIQRTRMDLLSKFSFGNPPWSSSLLIQKKAWIDAMKGLDQEERRLKKLIKNDSIQN
jgi:hypothetical protein